MIVQKNNPNQLMEAMVKFHKDPVIRKYYKNIFKDILVEYDLDNVATKYEELYKKII